MTDDTQQLIEKEIRRIIKGLEIEFGVECGLTYEADYPPLYNDPHMTDFMKSSMEKMNDPDIERVIEFPPFSGSEDFAYYTEKIPGSFFFIGCKPKGVEQAYFNHHPQFDIDEDALLVAAKSVGQVVYDYFKTNG